MVSGSHGERGFFESHGAAAAACQKISCCAGLCKSKQQACPELPLDCCSFGMCGFVMCSFVMWQPPAHLKARERLLCERRQVRLARRQQLRGGWGRSCLSDVCYVHTVASGSAQAAGASLQARTRVGARCKRAECVDPAAAAAHVYGLDRRRARVVRLRQRQLDGHLRPGGGRACEQRR